MKKKLLIIIIVLVSGVAGYFVYQTYFTKPATTQYLTTTAQKSTLVVSVSSSGQVSASNQVNVNAKVSGNVIRVGASQGDSVKANTTLAQIDSTDAQKAVRDAQSNLESAQLSLDKLQQPVDSLSILQAENSLAQANDSLAKDQSSLTKSYDDGFNSVSNAFLDLPTVMTGLNSIVSGYDISKNQANLDYYADAATQYSNQASQYRNDAYDAYNAARVAYDKNFADYKSTDRSSSNSTVEAIISETYATSRNIADAVKSINNLIQFYKDQITAHGLKPQSLADTHLASLNTYTGNVNSNLSSLLSSKNTIQNSKDALISDQRSIDEKTQSLAKLKVGPDPLDIRSQQLTIQQRKNSVNDAIAKLADYTVRAPFGGTIATMTIKKGDILSSNSLVATVVTNQSIAEVTLNEVDVAKIKVGQKVTLTFDALPDLSLTGVVASIDTLGTVMQGVVNYTVKIGFDAQDARVKSGMSVSAAIITNVKQDVITVPNSAIKTDSNGSYVQILNSGSIPVDQAVVVGLANDTMTEITQGINEGDKVVTQTILPSASTSSTKTSGGISIPGLTGGGSGNAGGSAGGGAFRGATGRGN